jgi:hypothetical protein
MNIFKGVCDLYSLGKFISMRPLLAAYVRVNEYQKKRICVTGKGTRFSLASRIDNYQNSPTAIQIGAHSKVSGQLLVFKNSGQITIGEYCAINAGTHIW